MNFLLFKYYKEAIAILLLVAVTWLYKNWEFQKAENIRQTENNRQLRMADSLNYSKQVLNERELREFFEYERKDLKKLLQESNIRESRIQSLWSNQYRYKNDSVKSHDVSQLVPAIKENRPITVPFSDSDKCLTIKGTVSFKNDSLKVNITERDFKNTTDNVVYWERRQWKFLGIKTRFLGKKQFTAKNFDQCGESNIVRIEKKQ
jgi:hypothetical protein